MLTEHVKERAPNCRSKAEVSREWIGGLQLSIDWAFHMCKNWEWLGPQWISDCGALILETVKAYDDSDNFLPLSEAGLESAPHATAHTPSCSPWLPWYPSSPYQTISSSAFNSFLHHHQPPYPSPPPFNVFNPPTYYLSPFLMSTILQSSLIFSSLFIIQNLTLAIFFNIPNSLNILISHNAINFSSFFPPPNALCRSLPNVWLLPGTP